MSRSAPMMSGPKAAADHVREPHHQLLELTLRARCPRHHVRVAVTLASHVLEAGPLETAQPLQPRIGVLTVHACPLQLLGGGAQEVERRLDTREP